MKEEFYVYILSSNRNGTLYVGVTSNLIKRVWEYKNKFIQGFNRKYNIDKRVYYNQYRDAQNAIKREKRIKKYNRMWKLELIEKSNPEWKDLYNEITGLSGQAGQ
ncbi:MAG: GIY-YIG nuclease family protein [Nitrospiraceae bacterium]|nr:MAG: GIY-YIG nuclease family protein [Nitrospiraceae bacterium]